MKNLSSTLLQVLIFTLVFCCYASIYLVQPILPLLREEFSVSTGSAAQLISLVTLGIAVSSLIFGRLSDLMSAKPLIVVGGLIISSVGLLCTQTENFDLLLGLRFLQGLFVPTISACLAAYLARKLPQERLSVALGTYVSSTAAGSLGGRLLGGWIIPPYLWRYTFAGTSLILLLATLAAAWLLPQDQHSSEGTTPQIKYMELMKRPELVRLMAAGFCGLFCFQSVLNYLPFYLSAPPFLVGSTFITLIYLTNLIGVVIGPPTGKLCNRFGNGMTILGGSLVLAIALLSSHLPYRWAAVGSLCLCSVGFFTIYAATIGGINRRMTHGQGHANSLYTFWYYLGGSTGVWISGLAFHRFGWTGLTGIGLCVLVVMAVIAAFDMRAEKRAAASESGHVTRQDG